MSGDLRRALAKNVRQERTRLGLSQDELAARCELHRTYIGGIERAERNVTLSTVEKIARALELEPLRLLNAEEGKLAEGSGHKKEVPQRLQEL